MVEKIWYIYIIENMINGKIYVGQTVNPNKRKWDHLSGNSSNCRAISNAVGKYGSDSLDFVLLEKLYSLKDANVRESYWITYLDTLAPNGYNLRTGGDSFVPSEESRQRMRESHMGQSRKFSEEHKAKIGLSKLGKSRSIETRKKISEKLKGIPLSEERKNNMRLSSHWGNKTHCIRGHPFDKVNTRYRKNGGRDCRACGRLHKRIKYNKSSIEPFE
jgi:group I intron endonuclease